MITTYCRIILLTCIITFIGTLLNGQNEHKIEDAIFDSDNLLSQEVLIILEDQASLNLSHNFASSTSCGAACTPGARRPSIRAFTASATV